MRTRHWDTFFIGCVFGLLPLIAWILAHSLVGGREIAGPEATREFLFFALSTASTSLLNLGEDSQAGRSHRLIFMGQFLTILSALFYGDFLTGEAVHAAMRVRFAYNMSRCLAGAAILHGAVVTGIIQGRSSK
jgi:hypothetical protein